MTFYVGSFPSIFGYKIVNTSNTTVTLGGGVAQANDSSFLIAFNGNSEGAHLVIDNTVIGANGCWPLAFSTQVPGSGFDGVFVAVIGDTTGANGTAAIFVTGDIDDTLPPGYDCYRILNLAVCNSSGNIVPLVQGGSYGDRTYTLQDAFPVLTNGAATTYTNVDLGDTVLGTDVFMKRIDFKYSYTPNSAANIATIIPATLTPASVPSNEIKTNGTAEVRGNFSITPGPLTDGSLNSDAAVQYKVTSASDVLTLWVSGFEVSYDTFD